MHHVPTSSRPFLTLVIWKIAAQITHLAFEDSGEPGYSSGDIINITFADTVIDAATPIGAMISNIDLDKMVQAEAFAVTHSQIQPLCVDICLGSSYAGQWFEDYKVLRISILDSTRSTAGISRDNIGFRVVGLSSHRIGTISNLDRVERIARSFGGIRGRKISRRGSFSSLHAVAIRALAPELDGSSCPTQRTMSVYFSEPLAGHQPGTSLTDVSTILEFDGLDNNASATSGTWIAPPSKVFAGLLQIARTNDTTMSSVIYARALAPGQIETLAHLPVTESPYSLNASSACSLHAGACGRNLAWDADMRAGSHYARVRGSGIATANLTGSPFGELIACSENRIDIFQRLSNESLRPIAHTTLSQIPESCGVAIFSATNSIIVGLDNTAAFLNVTFTVESSGSVTLHESGAFNLSVSCGYPSPAIADIDGDGTEDLLVGCRDGHLRFFEWGDNEFVPVNQTYSPFASIAQFESAIAPALGDVDGDGDPDLVLATADGTSFFYENLGTAEAASFGPSISITVERLGFSAKSPALLDARLAAPNNIAPVRIALVFDVPSQDSSYQLDVQVSGLQNNEFPSDLKARLRQNTSVNMLPSIWSDTITGPRLNRPTVQQLSTSRLSPCFAYVTLNYIDVHFDRPTDRRNATNAFDILDLNFDSSSSNLTAAWIGSGNVTLRVYGVFNRSLAVQVRTASMLDTFSMQCADSSIQPNITIIPMQRRSFFITGVHGRQRSYSCLYGSTSAITIQFAGPVSNSSLGVPVGGGLVNQSDFESMFAPSMTFASTYVAYWSSTADALDIHIIDPGSVSDKDLIGNLSFTVIDPDLYSNHSESLCTDFKLNPRSHQADPPTLQGSFSPGSKIISAIATPGNSTHAIYGTGVSIKLKLDPTPPRGLCARRGERTCSLSKAVVDSMFIFSENLGSDYNGTWSTDSSILEVVVLNASGNTNPALIAGAVFVRLRDSRATTNCSDLNPDITFADHTEIELKGSFHASQRIISAVASDGCTPDDLSTGDSITITLSQSVELPIDGDVVIKRSYDGKVASGVGTLFGTFGGKESDLCINRVCSWENVYDGTVLREPCMISCLKFGVHELFEITSSYITTSSSNQVLTTNYACLGYSFWGKWTSLRTFVIVIDDPRDDCDQDLTSSFVNSAIYPPNTVHVPECPESRRATSTLCSPVDVALRHYDASTGVGLHTLLYRQLPLLKDEFEYSRLTDPQQLLVRQFKAEPPPALATVELGGTFTQQVSLLTSASGLPTFIDVTSISIYKKQIEVRATGLLVYIPTEDAQYPYANASATDRETKFTSIVPIIYVCMEGSLCPDELIPYSIEYTDTTGNDQECFGCVANSDGSSSQGSSCEQAQGLNCEMVQSSGAFTNTLATLTLRSQSFEVKRGTANVIDKLGGLMYLNILASISGTVKRPIAQFGFVTAITPTAIDAGRPTAMTITGVDFDNSYKTGGYVCNFVGDHGTQTTPAVVMTRTSITCVSPIWLHSTQLIKVQVQRYSVVLRTAVCDVLCQETTGVPVVLEDLNITVFESWDNLTYSHGSMNGRSVLVVNGDGFNSSFANYRCRFSYGNESIYRLMSPKAIVLSSSAILCTVPRWPFGSTMVHVHLVRKPLHDEQGRFRMVQLRRPNATIGHFFKFDSRCDAEAAPVAFSFSVVVWKPRHRQSLPIHGVITLTSDQGSVVLDATADKATAIGAFTALFNDTYNLGIEMDIHERQVNGSIPGHARVFVGTAHLLEARHLEHYIIPSLFSASIDSAAAAAGTAVRSTLESGTHWPSRCGKCSASLLSGWDHSCLRTSNGKYECWGDNSLDQAYPSSSELILPDRKSRLPYEDIFWDDFSLGWVHTCGTIGSGRTKGRSPICFGQSVPRTQSMILTPESTDFTSIAAGVYHTCGLTSVGQVACWGEKLYLKAHPPFPTCSEKRAKLQSAGAQASSGMEVTVCYSESYEKPHLGGRSFISISASVSHTCAIEASDGSATCWGLNTEYQLGKGQCHMLKQDPGEHTCSNTPGPFTMLSLGLSHTCGLLADSSVRCWGTGMDPIKVPGSQEKFLQIDSGLEHTCGVRKQDGSIRCWGVNTAGQLDSPSGGGFVEVSAGSQHSCALRGDRTLYYQDRIGKGFASQLVCWGTYQGKRLSFKQGSPWSKRSETIKRYGLEFASPSSKDDLTDNQVVICLSKCDALASHRHCAPQSMCSELFDPENTSALGVISTMSSEAELFIDKFSALSKRILCADLFVNHTVIELQLGMKTVSVTASYGASHNTSEAEQNITTGLDVPLAHVLHRGHRWCFVLLTEEAPSMHLTDGDGYAYAVDFKRPACLVSNIDLEAQIGDSRLAKLKREALDMYRSFHRYLSTVIAFAVAAAIAIVLDARPPIRHAND